MVFTLDDPRAANALRAVATRASALLGVDQSVDDVKEWICLRKDRQKHIETKIMQIVHELEEFAPIATLENVTVKGRKNSFVHFKSGSGPGQCHVYVPEGMCQGDQDGRYLVSHETWVNPDSENDTAIVSSGILNSFSNNLRNTYHSMNAARVTQESSNSAKWIGKNVSNTLFAMFVGELAHATIHTRTSVSRILSNVKGNKGDPNLHPFLVHSTAMVRVFKYNGRSFILDLAPSSRDRYKKKNSTFYTERLSLASTLRALEKQVQNVYQKESEKSQVLDHLDKDCRMVAARYVWTKVCKTSLKCWGVLLRSVAGMRMMYQMLHDEFGLCAMDAWGASGNAPDLVFLSRMLTTKSGEFRFELSFGAAGLWYLRDAAVGGMLVDDRSLGEEANVLQLIHDGMQEMGRKSKKGDLLIPMFQKTKSGFHLNAKKKFKEEFRGDYKRTLANNGLSQEGAPTEVLPWKAVQYEVSIRLRDKLCSDFPDLKKKKKKRDDREKKALGFRLKVNKKKAPSFRLKVNKKKEKSPAPGVMRDLPASLVSPDDPYADLPDLPPEYDLDFMM